MISGTVRQHDEHLFESEEAGPGLGLMSPYINNNDNEKQRFTRGSIQDGGDIPRDLNENAVNISRINQIPDDYDPMQEILSLSQSI